MPAVAQAQPAAVAPSATPPAAPREFRGTWIPSVYNLGWPSKKGLSSQQQQQEMIAQLDEAASLNINAVLFQVRPAGDALYQTNLAPWSEFLSGTQGKAPEPFYDPLTFAIQEAHKRGIQLHAWINPYRVGTRLDGDYAKNSAVNTMAPYAKKLDKLIWLDPAEPAVRAHVVDVVKDIVSRYDVDGIHIDDYFYPYTSEMKSTKNDFPDQDSWARYQASGGKMDKGDWRRSHVDELMKTIYTEIKRLKPQVYFSIAPFGIWRPGHPEGIAGMDAYSAIYGDSRKWVQEGWLDANMPQLYWDLSKKAQSFPKLLAWWREQDPHGRHLWPGISISGAGSNFPTDDVIQRIGMVREQEKDNAGVVLWSFTPLFHKKSDLGTKLKRSLYATPALVPPSPWMDNQPPAPPAAQAFRDPQTGGIALRWGKPAEADVLNMSVYAQVNGKWQFAVVPAASSGYRFGANINPTAIFIAAVDRTGNESQRVSLLGQPAAAPAATPAVQVPAAGYAPGAATEYPAAPAIPSQPINLQPGAAPVVQ